MALLTTPRPEVGWQAPSFELADAGGRNWSSPELFGSNGLLVMFICNHCPYVQAVVERLVVDCRELKTLGVRCVAVMPNDVETVPADSPEAMARFAEAHGFDFPYLYDSKQDVARAFDAVCTPDFFGLSAEGALIYRGRLDSGGANANPGTVERELVNAYRNYIETGAIVDAPNPSMGCSIKWRRG